MNQTMISTKKFNCGGITIAVHSNEQNWLAELQKSLSAQLAPDHLQAEMEVELIEVADAEIDKLLPLPEKAYQFDEARVMLDKVVTITSFQRQQETWQEIEGYARIHVNHEKRRGEIFRRQARWITNPYFTDSFFAVNLIQKLLAGQQFHTIHASCVEVNGRGVIITGPGGRGKSTSGYALARKGHPFLNDEKVMLKLKRSYRACSISDIFKIREDAMERFFPELLEAQPLYRSDADEYCFKTSYLSGMQAAVECNADILIILHQIDRKRSAARIINPARVVGELFPVTMNPRNIKSTTEKFEFLTDFLQQVTCYQVDFGFDMDEFAALIEDMTR